MKAQRRHELKESDLAHALKTFSAYLDEHGKRITIAAIILGAVAVSILLGVRSRAVAIEDAWRRRAGLKFDDPQSGRESLAALAAMTEEVSNERFVFTALVEQGQQALRLAQQIPDPPDPQLNQAARRAFEQLLERFGDNPLAIGIAHSGLATVEENDFILDGDPAHKKRADEHLAAIINEKALNATPFHRVAMDRRKALDSTFSRVEIVYSLPPEELAEEADVP